MRNFSEFFTKLKKLCKNKGVSINQMQRDCGFSSSTVYKWKDGNVSPNATAIDKMARYFNVSTDEIMLHTAANAEIRDTPAANNNVSPPNNKTCDNTNIELISIIKSQHETLREQLQTKDVQMRTKDEQLHTKDEQMQTKDEHMHDLTEIIKKKDEQQHDLTKIIEKLVTKDELEPQKQVQSTPKKGRPAELE